MLSAAGLWPPPEFLAGVMNAHISECNVMGTYWDLLRERNIECFIVRRHIIGRCCVLIQLRRSLADLATYDFGAILCRFYCYTTSYLSHLPLNPRPALQLAA